MSRLLRMLGVVLGAIACLAPPATLAVLIGRFGVNIPYTDQWELVLLMQKERRVGLTFGDLVAQHGEQRMVFPRMVMLALARLTNWNIRAELLVNLLLAAGMMIILFWMLSRSLSGSGKWLMTPVASASLMIFSPVQWENWLWGWAIGWFLTPLCLLVAVAALAWWPPDRPGWPAMIVAMGAAVVGQYSLFNGTLIWLTCLPIMAVRKNLRRFIGIWVAAGGTLTALYLFKHQSTHWERFYPSLGSLVRKPQRPVEYLSYFLGRPVLDNRPVFWVGGSLLLLFIRASAYLVASRRDRLERGLVWFSVGSYAL